MSADRSLSSARALTGARDGAAGWVVGAYAGRITVVTIAGLAARLALLAYQPLWRDEAFTAVAVSRPIGQMLDAVRADSAPPLAYVVEHVVASVWTGAAGLRLFPALAGAAAIPIGAALGRRIAGDRGGVVSAIVCAIAPALVLTSVDARMYAIATTLVMASTLVLWRATEQPSAARWFVYGLITALALYTDYFAVLAIPAQLVATRFVLRASWRTTMFATVAATIAAVALIPWLVAATAQLTHAGQSFWVPQVGVNSVGGAFLQFFTGPPLDPWVPLHTLLTTLKGLACAAGLVAVFALILRRYALGPAGRQAAIFCATCGLGAVLLLFPLSIWHPLVDGRYAGVVWGPLFPLVAAGLAVLPIRALFAACTATLAACTLALSLATTHPPTPSVITWLDQHVQASDLVDDYPSQYLLFLYYAPPRLLSRTLVVQQSVAWFWGTAAYPPGAVSATIPESVVASRGAVYYVRQVDEPDPLLPPNYTARSTMCWTGVCVVRYAP
ncbi:MAG: glycosyltransferase family 39 protein [Candidatus Dormibacteraeota bacterium]|nr:glycosyltransferase family 39 protein [Candidatus Dormibacteraeota bacterium]